MVRSANIHVWLELNWAGKPIPVPCCAVRQLSEWSMTLTPAIGRSIGFSFGNINWSPPGQLGAPAGSTLSGLERHRGGTENRSTAFFDAGAHPNSNGPIHFAPTGTSSCMPFFSRTRSAQHFLLRSEKKLPPLVYSRCGRPALFFVTVTRMCLSAPLQRTRLWAYTSDLVGWVARVPTSSPGPFFFPLAPF